MSKNASLMKLSQVASLLNLVYDALILQFG